MNWLLKPGIKGQVNGMSDLISREHMKSLGATCIASRSKDGNMFPIVAIDELPSAQPEIIRCKDCRFYEFKQGSLPWNNSRRYCNRSVSLSTQENDYCSYAELRGDDDVPESIT